MKNILTPLLLALCLCGQSMLANAQNTKIHEGSWKAKPSEEAYLLPPFYANISPALNLPRRLGKDRIKGMIIGASVADTAGNIHEVRLISITLQDKSSNDTLMYHVFRRYGGIGPDNIDKLPKDAIPYFKWWHKKAPKVTTIRKANRMKMPGVTLSPPIRDTNRVRSVYIF